MVNDIKIHLKSTLREIRTCLKRICKKTCTHAKHFNLKIIKSPFDDIYLCLFYKISIYRKLCVYKDMHWKNESIKKIYIFLFEMKDG